MMIAVGSMLTMLLSHQSNVWREVNSSTRHLAWPQSLKNTLVTKQPSKIRSSTLRPRSHHCLAIRSLIAMDITVAAAIAALWIAFKRKLF